MISCVTGKYKIFLIEKKRGGRRNQNMNFLQGKKKLAKIYKNFKFKLTSYVSGTYFLEALSSGSESKNE